MNAVPLRLEEIKHANPAYCSSSKVQYYQLKSEFDDNFLAFFLNISLLSILPGIFLIGLVIHPPKLCYDRFIIWIASKPPS